MKKNKMMRLASAMMVLTLMSTSVISGTFAKYVTTASGTDTARVAKWGVEVTSTSDLFANTYATDNGDVKTTIENSVVAGEAGGELVAPGTTKKDVAFTIKGTPEVAVKVEVKIDEINKDAGVKDVVLKTGTYTDYTKVIGYDASGNPTYGTFELTEDYYPLVWTLKNGTEQVATGKLSDIKTYLESTLSKNYEANTDLSKIGVTTASGQYELSWTWEFEQGKDAADTLLGNIAAGTATVDNAQYCLDVAYTLSITVTQID